MPRRQHPPEIRELAIKLAAGGNASAAAREVGASATSVQRWVDETEPALIRKYVEQKSAIAGRIAADHIESVTKRAWEAMETVPIESAKDLQALLVSYGIGAEKMRLNAGLQGGPGGTRFGTSPDQLSGWSSDDRVTLERIERLTISPDPQPQAPQVLDQPAPPPGVRKGRRKST